MPIKFKCPHCQRGLSVKEHLAGKTAKCPACKKALKIPAPGSSPADAEELAMSVLKDKPAEAPAEEPKTIDFACPQCDEPVQAPAELAGKQMPCPHCRRIVKVPVPEKKEPTDWRKAKTAGPSAARANVEPQALEGAWTAGSTAAHRESLEEAGAIPEEPERVTVAQRVVRYGAPTLAVLFLLGGGWWVYHVVTQNKETRAVEQALKAKTLDGRPEAQAALHRAAGEYFLRTNKRYCAERARQEFGKARVALGSVKGVGEHDLLLIELALSQVDLGGTPAEVENGTRRNWVRTSGGKLNASDAGVDQEITQTLQLLQLPQAQLLAAREVGRKLVAKGQPQVAARLPALLSGDLGPEVEAHVGLELFRSNPALAEAAATQALKMLPQDKKGAPQDAPPSLVALCLVLNKPDLINQLPPDARAGDQSDKPAVILGVIERLGLEGNAGDAGNRIGKFPKPDQMQPRLVLAEALASQQPEEAKKELQEAAKLVDRRASAWQVLRLLRLAGRVGLDSETLENLNKAIKEGAIQDPGLRAWALLEVLRAQLAATRERAELGRCEDIDNVVGQGKYTAAAYVAREELARHNARLGVGSLDEVQKWGEELYRSFGTVGTVLGGQDR
jgi:hypothetical protein